MDGGWLCDACRSINRSRDKRCYGCRAPRRAVEHREGTEGITRAVAGDATTRMAMAVGRGARYRPTWPLALGIIPLIAAVAVLDALLWPQLVSILRSAGGATADGARNEELFGMLGIEFGMMLVAVVLWSVWMAICLGNVPALTGRWPGFGPSDALTAPLGLRSWRYRPMQVVREVVDQYAGQRIGPGLLVTAWWAAWLAAYILPGLYVLLRRFVGSGTPRDTMDGLLIRPYLLGIAAVLAIALVLVVERLQHGARVRRDRAVLLAQGVPG